MGVISNSGKGVISSSMVEYDGDRVWGQKRGSVNFGAKFGAKKCLRGAAGPVRDMKWVGSVSDPYQILESGK